MILKPKWSKFQNPWNSSPKLGFFDLGRSIVSIEFLYHVALHKQTKIDTSSLCIDEGLVIVVSLSIVVFWPFDPIFQKRSISSKSSEFNMYFYSIFVANWSSKVTVLSFSIRSSYYQLPIGMLVMFITFIFFLIYTYLHHLLYNHDENPTSSQECIFFRIHLTKS